ncbi:MAG: folylpolyglutamate synthase/dihydrofolate synthase family protein [Elusimicrobiota bacterium]
MKYNQVLTDVKNLDEFSYNFNLSRIKSFLEKLENPQNKIKIIHVAGTNGKGSVCAYISTILEKADYTVGLYTSPHLLDIRERIQIDRNCISKKEFSKFVSQYLSIAINYQLTYFEFLTAMAFWYFEREKVDFAVFEVGLGGRLDATNIIEKSLISVITNISLEHTQYLGNTISKIATEKAGIIKNNGFVITGATGIALQTIKKIAKIKNAKIIKIKNNREYFTPAQSVDFNFRSKSQDIKPCVIGAHSKMIPHLRDHFANSHDNKDCEISLYGEHQKKNADLAAETCRFLGIAEKYISNGLQNTAWRARFEVKHLTTFDFQFIVVLDCAHNPSGMNVLNSSIKKYFGKKINIVFGVLADKDYRKMIKIISSVAESVFISAPKNKRALDVEIVKKEFAKHISQKNIFIFDSIKTAIKSAMRSTHSIYSVNKSRDFCVTGSVYTVGEAIECLKI